MIVPDKVRKCVAFIGYQMADATFRMAGSVFFLGREREDGTASPTFAVTARHVIEGIRRTGLEETWLRLNLKDGSSQWFRAPIADWFFHPSDAAVDVSLLRMGWAATFDHLIIPFGMCITEQRMVENEVGLGDEVFVTGLFRHHHGNRRNIPIVRVGNLANLGEEKVVTRDFGEMDAYLIEARSIGGLSGSPVFLNLGVTRMIGGTVKHAQGEPIFYLLGLIHGHYDVAAGATDEVEPGKADDLTPDRVNTGIAVVVPFHKVEEVIDHYASQHTT